MKKTVKKGMVVTLSACMLANSVPLSNFTVQAALKQEFVEFTNEQNRGGWSKASGNGKIEFTDGENEKGYMVLSSDDNTIFSENQSEKRADGYVEMDMTLTKADNGGRMGIIFRYNNENDWQGIGIDSGSWNWFNGAGEWGSVTSAAKSFTKVGETHRIRVEYRGNNVKVLQDGVEIINQEIDKFSNEKAGNVGMRLWGKVSENYDCAFKIDNVKTGEIAKEVVLTPDHFTVDYEEAGKEDFKVTIAEESLQLTEIKSGNVALEKDKDYTFHANTVTIKKEYIAQIKDAASTNLTFVFEDGQQKTCSIQIKKEEEQVSYNRDFTKGTEGFEKVSGDSGVLEAGKDGVTVQKDGVFIDQNSKELKNQEVEFTYDPLNNSCNYGVVLRYTSPTDYIYVGPSAQNNQHYTKWGIYNQNGRLAEIEDSGFVLSGRDVPYKVKVRVVENVVTIFLDNEEIYNGEIGGLTTNAGKVGFRTTESTGMTIQGFTQETASAPEVVENTSEAEIASEQMTVTLDANFPRVVEYTLKEGGQTVKGQELALHQVELNNKLYTPKVTSDISGAKATYHVSEESTGISFDVIMEVKENVLSMHVKNIKDDKTKLYTLNFPEHSLISMSSKDAGGMLTVNDYRSESKVELSKANVANAYSETTLAVLSNQNVAATLTGESYKNRHEVAYQTFDAGDHTSTGLWVNEFTYRGLDGEVMYEPAVKVAITADRNKDGKVDYQDGAIALRDDCMTRKTGADVVTDTWTMVAMNVGSEAQYPFLRILDNVKKMSLAMDGFGQNIIIKGYQSEGHDSSHPDFANYNKRAGGLEDFQTLLENSEKYNAKIGIHVNHTDIYPESPQFGRLFTDQAAWSWYDSSKQIIRENDDLDKSENGLDGRFGQLYDKDTNGQIDSTYVDVFFGTRWPMYKLIENIAGRDIVLGTEYADEMASHSVFAHGIQVEPVASNLKAAGNLVRFVENNQSDIFQQHDLFRGVKDRNSDTAGINGWQTAKNMNNALQIFYEQILPNKFLAQYPVMQYTSNEQAVLGENNEVVTKMENGVNVITKDGKEVARGNKIFIPWGKDDDTEGKIYHYNGDGGESTWSLPNSWKDASQVTVYKLSENGKSDKQTVSVTDGKVTLKADAKTGYVLYKEEAKKIETSDTMEWSTGSPVKDMGFDSYNFDEWKQSSSAKSVEHITIEDNSLGNAHLYIKGKKDGQVEQVLTGLEKGQTYSASVWCITDDDRKASIKVENGDEVVANYMDSSNVKYGVHHNDKYQTYAQRMQVRFTATSDKAVLTLAAEEGKTDESVVDFDDVRVMKVNPSTNPEPAKYTYWEDFENVDQGYGVFVSMESDQSHLSQKNAVDPQYTPDVIDGNYSLKVRAGDYMRTIPSTVRLEPNTEYTVGIDYKSPSSNAFTFAVKSDKASKENDAQHAVVASEVVKDQEGKLVLKFTTGDYDDYYVDITKNAATEYYVDNFYVEQARAMNQETLEALIEEAKALDEKAYTKESFENMQAALKEAEKVHKNQNASKEEIEKAYTDLETAMENLDAYATAEDKEQLLKVIREMKSILASDYKQDEKWLAFQSALKEAESLYDSDKATQKEVARMIRDLREAKERLNPLVDRTALRAIMAKAERVDNNSVVDGKELQTFLSAYSEAKTTDLKPGVTETEILQATQKLTDAYNAIVLKEDSKNQLVSTALEKADEDVNYFLEKDWKEIQEAKAALEKMKNQTGVLVKDYFEVLDRLEAALEHKLSRPVVPSAVEIDSKNFKISANTEQADNAAHNEGPVKYAFDKNPNTIWHSSYNPMFTVSADNPAEITIDMGKSYTINQFSYLQRPAGGNNGKVQKYNLYVKSNQADEWKKIVSDGTFADKQELQKVTFDEVEAQYVKFEVTQGFGSFATAAELAVYQKASDFSKLQKAMDEAEKLDRTKYLEVYYSHIDQLCKEAEELLKDFMTEQAKIDALTEQLQKALDALEALAAKSDIKLLEEAVEAARNIDLDQYKNTKEFEKALSASEKLLAEYKKEERILQKDVTEAILKLTEEQGKLEEKDPVKPEKPEVDIVVVKAEQTTLKVGDVTKVSATITPEDAKDKAVTWSVSDENILSVSADGTVTAKKEGKAYVIATSSNGKTGRVDITVVSKDTVSNPESSKDEGKENKKEPVKTGDTQSTAWYIGLMAAVGAVVFGTKKKKEKDEM